MIWYCIVTSHSYIIWHWMSFISSYMFMFFVFKKFKNSQFFVLDNAMSNISGYIFLEQMGSFSVVVGFCWWSVLLIFILVLISMLYVCFVSPCVLCVQCCMCYWTVHFGLPRWCSLTKRNAFNVLSWQIVLIIHYVHWHVYMLKTNRPIVPNWAPALEVSTLGCSSTHSTQIYIEHQW
jgi:hypothetical protein